MRLLALTQFGESGADTQLPALEDSAADDAAPKAIMDQTMEDFDRSDPVQQAAQRTAKKAARFEAKKEYDKKVALEYPLFAGLSEAGRLQLGITPESSASMITDLKSVALSTTVGKGLSVVGGVATAVASAVVEGTVEELGLNQIPTDMLALPGIPGIDMAKSMSQTFNQVGELLDDHGMGSMRALTDYAAEALDEAPAPDVPRSKLCGFLDALQSEFVGRREGGPVPGAVSVFLDNQQFPARVQEEFEVEVIRCSKLNGGEETMAYIKQLAIRWDM